MTRKLLMLAGALVMATLFTAQAFAQTETTIRGRLGHTVEPGGWIIQASDEKYLLLNAKKFENEAWFRVGAEVEATGLKKPDAVTIYQEGVPFEASTVRPVEGNKGSMNNSASGKQMTRVTVLGTAVVQAQPDTAILSISVVTQSKNALDAQQQNAVRSDAVIRALKAAAGAGAEIKTSGYSLSPQRVYKENQPPTITGYEARNSVTVTMGDLQKVGAVIDAATQAGANNVDSISFTLRQDRPAKSQALADATREAISKAQALAQALGGRLVRIVAVEEAGVQNRPYYQTDAMMVASAKSADTPIEVGTLDINANVQLTADIETAL